MLLPALSVGDPRECSGDMPFPTIVYSDQVGHQTSDIRLLWTAITQTINPPFPTPPCDVVTPPPPIEDAPLPKNGSPPPLWPFPSPSTPPTHECFLASGSMENDSENTPRLLLCVCL